MEEVIISQYVESDKEAVLAGIVDLQETERVLTDTRRPGQEIAGQYLSGILITLAEKNGAIFVARVGGKTVGFIICWIESVENIAETDDSNRYGYISDAYVALEYRKLGIFTKLNERAEQYLAGFPQVKRIRICVLNDNSIALGAYEKTGYKKYEVILEKKV